LNLKKSILGTTFSTFFLFYFLESIFQNIKKKKSVHKNTFKEL